MDQLLVAPGGARARGARALRPRPRRQRSARHARRARSRPRFAGILPGTRFHYLVSRRGTLLEAEIPSRAISLRDFERYLLEGLLPALLFLALGAVVLALKPGVPETRLFLVFCLTWFCIRRALPRRVHDLSLQRALPHRRRAFVPARLLHLALTFPAARGASCSSAPWLLWLAYLTSAVSGAGRSSRRGRCPRPGPSSCRRSRPPTGRLACIAPRRSPRPDERYGARPR